MSEPTNEELVAAARAVVEMWVNSHLNDVDDMNDAVGTLAELLPPVRDGSDWAPKEGDPF
jgi:hypothetical protein